MLCVLPVFKGDTARLKDLLAWMQQLGGCRGHSALVVADAGTPYPDVLDIISAAAQVFTTTDLTTNPESVSGWIPGPKSLFFEAARWCHEQKVGPWFWLETDCVPLKEGWLDAIGDAYAACGEAIMGCVYRSTSPEFPKPLMSGVAVYPEDAIKHLVRGDKPFDVENQEWMIAEGAHTNLIQHLWGSMKMPPTFVAVKPDPKAMNIFTLGDLWRTAVVFHRNKDGTLLRLLRKARGIRNTVDILLVLPFCNKDAALAVNNIGWIANLGGVAEYDVLLTWDNDTNKETVKKMRDFAQSSFRTVFEYSYKASSNMAWPAGPNLALQKTARHIEQNFNVSWLWLESDAVPIKREWLDVLADEYGTAGKLFMGPVVPHFGHMNGVGIYPCDMASRCPKAMAATNAGWDFAMKDEMIQDCHDCGNLIQHVWGFYGGRPDPITGPAMTFKTQHDVDRWLLPSAVVFHRSKDGTLIDRLYERMTA